jgi:cytochrome c biogenesis protein CcmG/thiol:disulfide interchange protein DsbE
MKRLIRIVLLVLTLVSGLGIAGCSSEQETAPVLQAGKPAPDFQLQDLDGQTVALSSFQGKPVMLNFWSTGCPPCRTEMPFIQEVFEDEEWRQQGLVILALNLGESHSTVKKFMEDNGLSFTVLLDSELDVAGTYNIAYIPVTYFIDKNGIMRDRKIGSFASKADIDWALLNTIMEDE